MRCAEYTPNVTTASVDRPAGAAMTLCPGRAAVLELPAMVAFGFWMLLLFGLARSITAPKRVIEHKRWLLWLALLSHCHCPGYP